ncbi:MAG TPA: S9 family peptidase [Bryobacteraceae bacterium]|nr:S9 family peptidase [Bryobacteraceae bacterium]
MKHLRRIWFPLAVLILAASPTWAQQKRPLSFDDLMAIDRISEPMVSPDGLWVAYTVTKADVAANRLTRNIWIVSTNGTSEPRQITRGGSDGRPRWSPNSKRLAFVSGRTGTEQIYLLSLNGGEGDPLTTLSTGAGNEQWSPDGQWIAFTSAVYPDCHDDACNRQRDEAQEKNPVKARIYDHLLFRHWTHWSDGKRSHLFVIAASGGAPRDLTPGADYDVPPDERGDAADIAFSPDSKELCFTAITDRPEATTTNGDLFTVSLTGGEPRRITTNPGFDGHPIYSPDGRSIAYHAQLVAGYESDRWRLMLYDRTTQRTTNLTENFDRSVQEPLWSPDGRRIYFVAEDQAEQPIYAIDIAAGGMPHPITPASYNSELSVSADGNTLAFTRSSVIAPSEIFIAHPDGAHATQLTNHNAGLLSKVEMNPPESFWFEGANGARVEGFLIRPPHFDASKKYPLLLLVHGGPQGSWGDDWGYRWNEELFASPGYVAVMINPRGSTGYGQKFVDEIRDDWGGKVYDDLMKGTDYALAHYPFIDASRTAAAGGSYGGYMMDWFATHTGRFKALISHAGPYDNVSMYGGTEELWFVEHDLAGLPWSNPESYSKWSPSTYAGELGKFKTPTLVIAGEMDYRVPYTQSLEFFTDLQRQNVPSKLLIFPDEGHWVGKPQNSRLWYKNFFDWLATYLK